MTRQEVLDDIENSRWDKLKKTMLNRQKFGTAGLRARMGAGYMCMNDVVVLQTAQVGSSCSYCCWHVTWQGFGIVHFVQLLEYTYSYTIYCSQFLAKFKLYQHTNFLFQHTNCINIQTYKTFFSLQNILIQKECKINKFSLCGCLPWLFFFFCLRSKRFVNTCPSH